MQEAAATHGSRPPRDREGRDGQVELGLEMGLEVDEEGERSRQGSCRGRRCRGRAAGELDGAESRR
jgi:hypothetical protein